MLRRLTFERAVLIAGTLIVIAIATRPATDPDLWWHLRSGQWMIDHRSILRADPFSHTRRGAVREPTDWLSELGLYGTWSLTRLPGIALLVALIATAGMALIVRACQGPVLVRVGVATLAASASSVFWSSRPQMVTFLGTAVVVLAMAWVRRVGVEAGRSVRRLWLLVPLFALWSNLHLGWFYGLGVLGATMVGELMERARGRRALTPSALRTVVAVTAASVVAVMVNPVGPRIWSVVVTQVDVGRAYIQENQPPRLSEAVSAPFFLMLAVTCVVLAVRWRRVSATEVLLVAGSAAAALTSVRTVPLFATAAAPVLSAHLSALLAVRRPDVRRTRARAGDVTPSQAAAFNAGLLLLLALLVTGQTARELGRRNVDSDMARRFPVAATAWVQAHDPPGELFNTFDWGGYLIWKLRDYPVSIDGRADLYADDLDTYVAVLAGKDWQRLFARERIGVAIVPVDSGLARAAGTDPGWRVAHRDRVAVVLVRR